MCFSWSNICRYLVVLFGFLQPTMDQQPNLLTSLLTDPDTAPADTDSPGVNFSPAVLLSPTAESMKSPNYSFSSTSKVSPGGGSVSQAGSGVADRQYSPDHPYQPSPGRLADVSDEALKLEHRSHIFDIGCKFCTNSFTQLSPGANVGRRDSTGASQSSKPAYSSPSAANFKVPIGGAGLGGGSPVTGGEPRKRKFAKVEEDESSPVSS